MKQTAYSLKQLLGIKDYEQKADEFLRLTNSSLVVKYIETGLYFNDTKKGNERDIYEFTLSKDGRHYTSKFGDSLSNTWKRHAKFNEYENEVRYKMSKMSFPYIEKKLQGDSEPSNYSVLACLQACEPSETFDDFINECGYEIDSKKSYEDTLEIYGNVVKEWTSLMTLYNTQEMDVLSQIQ